MDDTSFGLPPVERAAHYRQLAEQMRSRAASAVTEETRIGYLNAAVEWLDMADRLELQHGKVTVIVSPELAALLRGGTSKLS